MLTKEECLRALTILATKSTNAEDLMKIYPYFKYELDMMINLIEEHFDNPPLKFAELRKNMWVWDNYDGGGWLCIAKIDKEKMRVEDGYFWEDYKENRFYRKQVD